MDSEILMDDYAYELPDERIAQKAIEPRDSSKLLVYNSGQISDCIFKDINKQIPPETVLFFNNAKVIPARIFVKNANDASIEIFLLQPYSLDHVTALNATNTVEWECMIGNKKKWKSEEVLKLKTIDEEIIVSRVADAVVRFEWSSGLAFAEILESFGHLPLPPYIKHEADLNDAIRYQTIYSSVRGSVAAPTAGLHFSDSVLVDLKNANIPMHFTTLHVSAGTFLPVKSSNALQHEMHRELFSIDIETIKALYNAKKVIAVGTTSCRVLESIFWSAIQISEGIEKPFSIDQFVYGNRQNVMGKKEALDILIAYMEANNIQQINGDTSIMIVPGYTFRVINGLITNFHQPKSTLLLLISAFIGQNWKKVYTHALENNYRFLSYGDSSLLLP